MSDEAMGRLQAMLGYRFSDTGLLARALTHRSACPEHSERLEFLGDAVLGLIVADALYRLPPVWREGELTRVPAQLVSRQHIASVAAAIDLGGHLRLSPGEDRSGLLHTVRAP